MRSYGITHGSLNENLDHAFRHHSHGVFKRLSLVAEPYSDDLPFVA